MLLGLSLYKKKDAEMLYYGILNCFNHIIYDGYHYCFCDEYSGCELEYRGRQYCPLCRISYGFALCGFEKRCDKAQFKFKKLCKVALELLPYLDECFTVKPYELDELFSGEHSTYFRDRVGAKHETTLSEHIACDIEFKERNCKKSRLSCFNFLRKRISS